MKEYDMEKYHESFRLEVYNFLNELRESGKTNMFGARPYLVNEFDLSKKQSGELLALYMNNNLYTPATE